MMVYSYIYNSYVPEIQKEIDDFIYNPKYNMERDFLNYVENSDLIEIKKLIN